MAFNRLVMFAGNIGQVTNPAAEWLIDEIRIGTTYADVVPYTGGPVLPPIISGIQLNGGGGVDLSLQFSIDLASPNSWSNVPEPPFVVGNQLVVTNSTTESRKFFRLISQ